MANAPIHFDPTTANPFVTPADAESINPFAPGAAEARRREAMAVPDDAPEGTYTYRLVKSGPDVDPSEVELPNVKAVEVMILWDTTVLHVEHLSPPRSYYVGEEERANVATDYFIPSEALGVSRAPVVVADGGEVHLVIPSGARGSIEIDGETISLAKARERGVPCPELGGAHQLRLPPAARARVELGKFVFQVATVDAGKPIPRGVAAGFDWAAASYFGMSFLAAAAVIGAAAFFVPPLGLTGDEGPDKEQLVYMQAMIEASAERDRKQREEAAEEAASESEGGTGERAAGEEGQMGKELAKQANKRWSIKGPKDNLAPKVAKKVAFNEFVDQSTVGLLNRLAMGDPNAPTSIWGGDVSLGADEQSFRGNMWGDDFGDSYGKNGLGLSGIGESGGGSGLGIGLGNVGTIGHGAGLGGGDGFGNHHGRLAKGHVTKTPRVRPAGVTTVTGRLPPQTIQRIVRNNYGSFRFCYQKGLESNPNLAGRVSVRFVINRDGAVSTAGNGGSDLPDSSVVSCIVRSFYGLSFPKPEGGIVTVVYPIALTPTG